MKVIAYFEEIYPIKSMRGDRKYHPCEPKLDILKCWLKLKLL